VTGWRWPAGILVLVALVAGLVVNAGLDDEDTTSVVAAPPPTLAVAVPDTELLTSTWYCPTVVSRTLQSGGIDAAGRLLLSEITGEDLAATVTLIGADGRQVRVPVEIPGGGQASVALTEHAGAGTDLEDEPIVGALVEAPRPALVVERRMVAGGGVERTPCAEQAGQEWFFAAGDTSRDSVEQLVVLNPFPQDAVVDLAFASEAEAGAFLNPDVEGIVIPGGELRAIVLTEVARRRDHLAVSVRSRSGRVAVDRMVQFDGSVDRVGLAVSVGSLAPAPRWVWPAGYVDGVTSLTVHVSNPTDRQAELDLGVLAGAAEAGEPLALSIPPQDMVAVSVAGFDAEVEAAENRIEVEPGLPFSVLVESANGVPVVVDVEVVHRPRPTPPTTTTTTTAPPITVVPDTSGTSVVPTTTPPTTAAPTTTAAPATTTTAGQVATAVPLSPEVILVAAQPTTTTTAAPATTTTAAATTAATAPATTATTAPAPTTTATTAPATGTTTSTTTTVPLDPIGSTGRVTRAEQGVTMSPTSPLTTARWLLTPQAVGEAEPTVVRVAVGNAEVEDAVVGFAAVAAGGVEPLDEVTVQAQSTVEIAVPAEWMDRVVLVDADVPVSVAVVQEREEAIGVSQWLAFPRLS
jgi:hypothetical protein